MIQLTKKHTVPVPSILTTSGVNETETLCQAFANGSDDFSFYSDIYGHTDVKATLRTVQNDKCSFCEAKIGHISYGDVEHYRPKKGWIQGRESLNRPGYYWLAYDWDNLFLSCQICNQRHKKNFFPLSDNSKRALSHQHNIAEEAPLFLKPDAENPEQFIEFKEEIPFSIDENPRGKATIQMLGLDRAALNENRKTKLDIVRTLYGLAKEFPETSQELKELKEKAIRRVKEVAVKYTADNAEYAAMFRAFFKNNPIDFE